TLIPCSLALPPPTICTPSLHDAPPLTKTTPTGTVSFSSDGAGVFAVSPCTLTTTNALDPTAPASCSVTYTPTAKGTGTHKITATYNGDPSHDTSTGFFNLTVSLRTTSTTVNCTPNPIAVDQPTTCTATVTDIDSGTQTPPEGTVTFTVNPSTGTLVPSSCALVVTGTNKSSCSVTFTASAAGTYTITATYNPNPPDTIHASSEGTTTVVVNPAPAAKVTGGGQIAVNGGVANFGFGVQRKTTGGLPVGQLQFYNHAAHE